MGIFDSDHIDRLCLAVRRCGSLGVQNKVQGNSSDRTARDMLNQNKGTVYPLNGVP